MCMKLKKMVCLGFVGSELEDSYWEEIDGVTYTRILIASDAVNVSADSWI
jgi:hypothetical protein